MGRTTTNQSNDLGIVSMTAGADISAGDLVINSDAGKAAKADAGGAFSNNNSTAEGATVLASARAVTNESGQWFLSTSRRERSSCELSNGNIVHTFSGNTGDPDNWVNFVIRNSGNGTLVSRVQVSNLTSIESIQVVSLIGQNKFVVSWGIGANIYTRVYDNDGTPVTSAITVFTDNQSGSARYWHISALKDGGFVVAANKSVSPYALRFKRYDSSGVLQGSETTVEASSNPFEISIIPVSDDGFVIAWYSAVNNRHSMSKYNAAGTLVGSQQNIPTSSSSNNGKGNWADNQVIELSDGKIAKLYNHSSTSYWRVSLRSSSLALLADVTLGSYSDNQPFPAMCRYGNGFAVVPWNGGSARLLLVSNSGGVISDNSTSLSVSGQNVAACGTEVTYFGGGYFGIFSIGNNDGGSSYEHKTTVVNELGVSSGSVRTLLSATTSYHHYAFWNSSNILISRYALTTNTYTMSTNNLRKSVLGVALDSVSADQTMRVGTKGVYQLTQDFAGGGNFDNTAATVGGSRGVIVGASANLFGIN